MARQHVFRSIIINLSVVSTRKPFDAGAPCDRFGSEAQSLDCYMECGSLHKIDSITVSTVWHQLIHCSFSRALLACKDGQCTSYVELVNSIYAQKTFC